MSSSVYNEGDFIVRKPGDVHQPMGANNGDCICLSALEAPISYQPIWIFSPDPFCGLILCRIPLASIYMQPCFTARFFLTKFLLFLTF